MASFIQFGDIPPDILQSYQAPENQDCVESHDDQSQSSSQFQTPAEPGNQDFGESHHDDQSQSSSQFEAPAEPENQDPEAKHMQPPISPQLRFFLTKKPPRTPRRFSRTVFPPPLCLSPPVVILSKVFVPSEWCTDNRLGHLGMYLSKDSLLPKMYKRWDLYRTFHLYAEVKVSSDMQCLGTPADYFLTYPLKPWIKPEGEQVQPRIHYLLEDRHHTQDDTLPVRVTGLFSTRNTLNLHPGLDVLPLGGRSFEWAMNSTGTKICSRSGFVKRGLNNVTGFFECPKCGEFWGISYGIARFLVARVYFARMKREIAQNAEQALRQSHFNCMCDGNVNPVRPFISDNFNRINWMCLLLGLNIGFCTVDQLKFFCRKRNLEVSDNKNFLLIKVCSDLLDQITGLGSSPPPPSPTP